MPGSIEAVKGQDVEGPVPSSWTRVHSETNTGPLRDTPPTPARVTHPSFHQPIHSTLRLHQPQSRTSFTFSLSLSAPTSRHPPRHPPTQAPTHTDTYTHTNTTPRDDHWYIFLTPLVRVPTHTRDNALNLILTAVACASWDSGDLHFDLGLDIDIDSSKHPIPHTPLPLHLHPANTHHQSLWQSQTDSSCPASPPGPVQRPTPRSVSSRPSLQPCLKRLQSPPLPPPPPQRLLVVPRMEESAWLPPQRYICLFFTVFSPSVIFDAILSSCCVGANGHWQ